MIWKEFLYQHHNSSHIRLLFLTWKCSSLPYQDLKAFVGTEFPIKSNPCS
nr:MAG TPA: hypothetical protein [Caudoviricetes sp.]